LRLWQSIAALLFIIFSYETSRALLAATVLFFGVSCLALIGALVARKALAPCAISAGVTFLLMLVLGINTERLEPESVKIARQQQEKKDKQAEQEAAKRQEEEDRKSAAQPETMPVEQPSQSSTAKVFDFSPGQLRDRFNQAARKYKTGLVLKRLKLEKGENGYIFTLEVNQNIGFAGCTNDKQQVSNITFAGVGDGSLISGARVLIAMGHLMSAVDPSLTPEDRGRLLEELGFVEGADFSKLEGETSFHNVRYTVMHSDQTPMMFVVAPE
jgi:hypothetical protein